MRYPTIEPLESRIAPAALSTVFIQDRSVVEGSSGSNFAVFVVTLDQPVPAGQHVTVDYSTADGTAHTGGILPDYTGVSSSQLVFAAGETSKTISIAITTDTAYEADETFQVKLANPKILDANNAPVNAPSGQALSLTLAPGTASGLAGVAVGTIQNDDVLPTASVTGPTSVLESVGKATFTISLSNPSDYDVTIFYSTVDGTAIGGDPGTADFTKIPHTSLIIPRGATSAQVSVDITNDSVIEPDKAFQFHLESAALATGPATALPIDQEHGLVTVQLVDDDPEVSIVPTSSIHEGNDGVSHMEFLVSLSVPSLEPVTVHFNTIDGTAHSVADGNGIDYVGVADGTITFEIGETQKTISIDVNGDTAAETDEAFTVQLTSADHAHILTHSQGVGTILNDDGPSHFQIFGADNGSSVTVSEDGKTVSLTIVRSGDVSQAASVTYSTIDGTAHAGEDYTAKTGTAMFAAAETSKTIVFAVTDDTIYEGAAQQFTVALSNATGGDILQDHPSVEISITDNDAVPVVSIGDASVLEGGALNFVVSLNHASDFPVTVHYSTADGTITDHIAVSGLDYTAAEGTLTIPAGSTSGNISITTLADRLQEFTENLTVHLSVPDPAPDPLLFSIQGTGIATGNILDPQNTITITSASHLEGNDPAHPNQMIFIVNVDRVNDADTVVHYKTINGTAIGGDIGLSSGVDFGAVLDGTLTIPAGSSQGQIAIDLKGDTVSEANETFSVQLLTPANGVINAGTALGTITNDDTAPLITISDSYAIEGAGVAFTVTLSGTSDHAITLTATPHELLGQTTVPGAGFGHTARASSDFNATPLTVTIPAGQTSATFSVPTTGNSNFGTWEQFSVDITGDPGLQQTTVTGTILDDDVYLSPDSRTAQWHDVDGDTVTLHVSKGKITGSIVTFLGGAANAVGGVTLSELDLFDHSFQKANVSITSEPDPLFQALPYILQTAGITPDFDHVNVGYIKASVDYSNQSSIKATDLGTVTIDGDLGRIDAGDNFSTPAIHLLDVLTLGKQGTTTGAPTTESHVIGPLSALHVRQDLFGSLQVLGLGYGNIGNLTVDGALNGSITADAAAGSIVFSGSLSKATIGSIIGGAGAGSGGIFAVEGNPGKIGSITILNNITGGAGANSGQISGGSIVTLKLGGTVGGSGANSGAVFSNTSIKNLTVGYSGLIGGAGTTSGSIVAETGHFDKVLIKGGLSGGQGTNAGSIYAAGGFGNIVVDGSLHGGTGSTSGSIVTTNGVILKATVKGGLQGYVTPAESDGAKLGGEKAGSILAGYIGPVSIGGDLDGGPSNLSGSVYASGDIAKVTVAGSLIGGTGTISGSIKSDGVARNVIVKGGLQGGAGAQSGSIFGTGGVGTVAVTEGVTGGGGLLSGSIYSDNGALSKATVGGTLTGGIGDGSGSISTGRGVIKQATVEGDLVGGDGNASGSIHAGGALNKATVRGGLSGGDGDDSGSIEALTGNIGTVSIGTASIGQISESSQSMVAGDGLTSGSVISFAGSINSLTLSGDIVGASVRAQNAIASLIVHGSVTGSEGTAVEITAGGAKTNTAIKKIVIDGDVSFTEILAGYDTNSSFVDPRGQPLSGDASISNISIGGFIKGVSIIAGVQAGVDDQFGGPDDSQITISNGSEIDKHSIAARIAHITVGGILATGTNSTYGFAANFVDSVKIGSSAAINPTDGVELLAGSNLFVREVDQPAAP